MEAALAVWRYCAQSVQRIFGPRLGRTLDDRLFDELCRRRPDWMNDTEIRDFLGRNVSGAEVAIRLVEAGLAKREVIDDGQPGRNAHRTCAL